MNTPAALYLAPGLLVFSLVACGGPRLEDDYVAAMAEQHAGEDPVATPATTASGDADEVVVERIPYFESVQGVLAKPVGTPRGGVVLVHEWWGLNDNIGAVARRLAAEGFVVFAVDLYEGIAAGDPNTARTLMQEASADPDRIRANVEAAAAVLRANGAPRVAVMGYCFGGGVALELAITSPASVDGAVVYYGRVPEDLGRLVSVDDPLLLHFGVLDEGIPIERARALASALDAAGVENEFYEYPGAGHAFANPSGQRYDAAAAELAWERTLTFLVRVLDPAQ